MIFLFKWAAKNCFSTDSFTIHLTEFHTLRKSEADEMVTKETHSNWSFLLPSNLFECVSNSHIIVDIQQTSRLTLNPIDSIYAS